MGVDFRERMNKCLLLVCFAACAAVATAGVALKITAYSDSKCTKALASLSIPAGICDTRGGDYSYSNVTKKVTRAVMTGTVKSMMRSMASCTGNMTETFYSDATCKTKATVPGFVNPRQTSAAQIKASLSSCRKETSNYKNLAANGLPDVYHKASCSSSGASSVVPAAAAGALALVAMWFT